MLLRCVCFSPFAVFREERLLWGYYRRKVWFSNNPCYKESPKW